MRRNCYSVSDVKLQNDVLDYWSIAFEGIGEMPAMKVPPMGFPVLHFHYGRAANFYRHGTLTCESVIIGQLTRHVMLHPADGVKFIGVNLKPYGLFHLLGMKPFLLQDKGIDSLELFGAEAVARVEQALREDEEAGLAAIEQLLLQYAKPRDGRYAHLDEMVDRMVAANGLVDLGELTGKNMSMRTLQRYFQEVIGISPKLFCQILRHKYILEQLYTNPQMKWDDLVLKGYYYDQSHFNKDFVVFAQAKPIEYLQMMNSYAGILLE